MAYRIIRPGVGAGEQITGIQKLMEEVAAALEVLADRLEENIVEEHELSTTLPQLDAVIRECARVKHWLAKECALDKQRENVHRLN